MERPLYDLRVAARFLMGPPSEAAAHLAVVAVDEPSLEALGPWPWSRKVHARLLEHLAAAGAAAAALDVILAEPPAPGMDLDVGATRESVNRTLARLQAQGVVVGRRRGTLLSDPSRLEEHCLDDR